MPGTAAHPTRSAAAVVLHFHLSDTALTAGHGVVRPEHARTISLDQLRTWLTETGCRVSVRPILDPAGLTAVYAQRDPAADAKGDVRRRPGRGLPVRSRRAPSPRPRPLRPHVPPDRTTSNTLNEKKKKHLKTKQKQR